MSLGRVRDDGRGMDEEMGWPPASGVEVLLMDRAESMGDAEGSIVLGVDQ